MRRLAAVAHEKDNPDDDDDGGHWNHIDIQEFGKDLRFAYREWKLGDMFFFVAHGDYADKFPWLVKGVGKVNRTIRIHLGRKLKNCNGFKIVL